MSTKFLIQSSDPKLLEKATRIAKEFVQKYICDDIVGVVFLGAIARGYFDPSADIDIAIFKKEGSEIPIAKKFYKTEDIEVQIYLSDYASSLIRGIWQNVGHILNHKSTLIHKKRSFRC